MLTWAATIASLPSPMMWRMSNLKMSNSSKVNLKIWGFFFLHSLLFLSSMTWQILEIFDLLKNFTISFQLLFTLRHWSKAWSGKTRIIFSRIECNPRLNNSSMKSPSKFSDFWSKSSMNSTFVFSDFWPIFSVESILNLLQVIILRLLNNEW